MFLDAPFLALSVQLDRFEFKVLMTLAAQATGGYYLTLSPSNSFHFHENFFM